MKYRSTRGGEKELSFKQVLFSGYAKDGGLYLPESIPRLEDSELRTWSECSYRRIMLSLTRKFIAKDEMPDQDLKDVLRSAFRNFQLGSEVEVAKLDDSDSIPGPRILELFRGPTYAFKDLALSVVSALLQYFVSKENKRLTILVGTSGDTGGAAIAAVGGRLNMELIVLLPRGRCSFSQLLQMVTPSHRNVTVFSVEGTSDDLDKPIKSCFADEEFVERHNLMSINSINWGRILGQIAHFFFAYYRSCGDLSDGAPLPVVEIVVPTGACGNIVAGCIAQQMGLPIQLIVAVNKNDIVARTVSKGDFSISKDVLKSYSSAMDIQTPYNVERLLDLFSGGDCERVATLMEEFESKGAVQVPQDIMNRLRSVITDSIVCGDDEALKVMRAVYLQHKCYLSCPHTATALYYHYTKPPKPDVPRMYLATASPVKFSEAVLEALTDPCDSKTKKEPPTEDGNKLHLLNTDPMSTVEVHSILVELNRPLDHLKALLSRDKPMDKGQDWLKMLKDEIEKINGDWMSTTV